MSQIHTTGQNNTDSHSTTWWRRAAPPTVVLIVASVMVAVGGGLVTGGAPPTQLATTTPTVAVVTATPADSWQRERRLLGRVEARRSSDLGFEIGGLVTAVLVDEGDTVSADQPLATIDRQRLRARERELTAQQAQAQAHLSELEAGTRESVLAQMQADLAVATARRDQAQARLERITALGGRDTISAEDRDDARFDVAAAEAALAAASWRLEEGRRGPRQEVIDGQRALVTALTSQLEQIAVDIDRTTIRAPYAGQVSRRLLDEGQIVAAGTPVLQVLEHAQSQVRVGVPPDLVADLPNTGGAVSVIINDHEHHGLVAALLPDRDPRTRSRIALINLTSDDAVGAVAPGDLAEVQLVTSVAQSGIPLPLTALREGERGLWSCLVVVSDAAGALRLEPRSVTIVHTAGDHVVVRGALNPGEAVVAGGLNRVVPGMTVQVADVTTLSGLPTSDVMATDARADVASPEEP